jgi:hypothetical protein
VWCGGAQDQDNCGGDDDEAKSKPVLSFMEALHAFETMRAFTYANNITERDQVNVRFEVFTAVTMKNGVFWDVSPCGSFKN